MARPYLLRELGEKQRVYDQQGGLCFYCQAPMQYFCTMDSRRHRIRKGKPITAFRKRLGPDCATWDHRVPVARGGSEGLDNRVLACFSCNQRKGSLTEEEYNVSA